MKFADQYKCAICGDNQMQFQGGHSDRRRGLQGSWEAFMCNGCGVIALLPTPTAVQLGEYYANYSSGETVNFSPSRWGKFPLLGKIFHWLTGEVDPRDFIKPARGANILDYGCGQAGYLVEFHSRGWNISGAEMSATVVEACQNHGLNVIQVSNPDEIPFASDSFDVVYLMQVFEHFRDPVLLMGELSRISKVGAELYLSVPNSRSVWRKTFAANWVSGWYAPFHLFQFDVKSLGALAEKHGFVIVDSWSRTPVSWFQLNLKAWLHKNNNQLDSYLSPLDSKPVRYLLMLVLRIVEIFVQERDCLVIKFVKMAECK